MRWGFLGGSLGLIVLYTVLQPDAATHTQQAGNVVVSILQRSMSPGWAGIPQKGAARGTGPESGNAPAPAPQGVGGSATVRPTTSGASSGVIYL